MPEIHSRRGLVPRSARAAFAALALLGLVGCDSLNSVGVITSDGPWEKRTDDQIKENPSSQINQFALLYLAAAKEGTEPNTVALYNKGASLISNACVDYFRKEGKTRATFNLLRDTVGGALTLGGAALNAFGVGGDAAAILGFTTTGSTAVINIAAQNFLFGADNIDDVRNMTLNALATHVARVKELRDALPKQAGFDWTVRQLMDLQALCEGPNILALAKKSIAKANIKSSDSATTQADTPKKEPTPTPRVAATPPAAASTGTTTTNTPLRMPDRIILRVEN